MRSTLAGQQGEFRADLDVILMGPPADNPCCSITCKAIENFRPWILALIAL